MIKKISDDVNKKYKILIDKNLVEDKSKFEKFDADISELKGIVISFEADINCLKKELKSINEYRYAEKDRKLVDRENQIKQLKEIIHREYKILDKLKNNLMTKCNTLEDNMKSNNKKMDLLNSKIDRISKKYEDLSHVDFENQKNNIDTIMDMDSSLPVLIN